jgi:hypothetical protein
VRQRRQSHTLADPFKQGTAMASPRRKAGAEREVPSGAGKTESPRASPDRRGVRLTSRSSGEPSHPCADAAILSRVSHTDVVQALVASEADGSSSAPMELRDALRAAMMEASARVGHRYAAASDKLAAKPRSLPTACLPPTDILLAMSRATGKLAAGNVRPYEMGEIPLPAFGSLCTPDTTHGMGDPENLVVRGLLPQLLEPLSSVQHHMSAWSGTICQRINAIAKELHVPMACRREDLLETHIRMSGRPAAEAEEEAWLSNDWREARGGPGGEYVVHTEEELLERIRLACARDTRPTEPWRVVQCELHVPTVKQLKKAWEKDLCPVAVAARSDKDIVRATNVLDAAKDLPRAAAGTLAWNGGSVWHMTATDVAGSAGLGTFRPKTVRSVKRPSSAAHGSKSNSRGRMPSLRNLDTDYSELDLAGPLSLAMELGQQLAGSCMDIRVAARMPFGPTIGQLREEPSLAREVSSAMGSSSEAVTGATAFGSGDSRVVEMAIDGYRRGLISRILSAGPGSLPFVVTVLRRGSVPGHRAALWERVLGLVAQAEEEEGGNDAEEDDDSDSVEVEPSKMQYGAARTGAAPLRRRAKRRPVKRDKPSMPVAQWREWHGQLMRRVENEWTIVDDLVRADVEACCEDKWYFPFEDAILQALMCFTRDTTVSYRCAAVPHEPIVGLAEDESAACFVPPCGVVLPEQSTMLLAPLSFVFGRDVPRMTRAFTALYCRHWSRVATLSSAPGTLIPLCRLFENMVSAGNEDLCGSLHIAGLTPLQFGLPLIRFGFATVASPRHVLELWDRMIAFNSTEVLAAAAAAVVLEAAPDILRAIEGLREDAARVAVEQAMSRICEGMCDTGGPTACLHRLLSKAK